MIMFYFGRINLKTDLLPLCLHIYKTFHIIQHLLQIKGFFCKLDTTRFQLTHVQNVVHQIHQHVRTPHDLIQTFFYFIHIMDMLLTDIYQPSDSVNRSTDIMAHPFQKICLNRIGPFCFFGCHTQIFLIRHLFSLLF